MDGAALDGRLRRPRARPRPARPGAPADRDAARARPPRVLRDRRLRARAVAVLRRDRPAADRDRAPVRVHGAGPVALWARFAWHEPVRGRVWPALALVLVGLGLVAQIWDGLTLDGVGRRRRPPRRLRARRLLPHGRAPRRTPRPDLGDVLRARLRLARLGGRRALVELPDRSSASRSSCRTGSAPCRSRRSRCGGSCSARSRRSPSRSSALPHLPATTVGIVATFEPVAAAVDRLGLARRGPRRGADPGRRRRARGDPARRDVAVGRNPPSAEVGPTTLQPWWNESCLLRPAATARASSAPSRRWRRRSSTTARPSTCASRSCTTSTSSATSRRGGRSSSTRRPRSPGRDDRLLRARRRPTVHANSASLGHDVIDATCPLVTKVHVQARRYADDGYTVILIGHAGHEEVVGTMGEAPEATVLVQDVAEAEALDLPPDDARRLHHADDAVGRRDVRDHRRAPPPLSETSTRRARRTSATRPPTASGR